ncbi:MAG: SPASM domain-containing protein, partial [Deltaproteobacteria bacterium]|nr:SPASM domain-containing protein [Deltaproteobacteria bacterium]
LIPCETFLGRSQFYLGDVKNGFSKTKYNKFEKWILSQGQFRIDNEDCRNCFAKMLCGGGCYAESFNNTGTLRALDEISCAFVRETVKINLYYISQIKNLQPKTFSLMSGKTIE